MYGGEGEGGFKMKRASHGIFGVVMRLESLIVLKM